MFADAETKSRWALAALLLVALLWFGALEYRALFKPDEGRYADIAREMLHSGDWVTPRLNGLKYFEKPPLQYWATAAAFAAFGPDEWTARLWPAVTGFLGVLLTAFAAFRLSPGRSWVPAALILIGSWGYILGGQFVTLDMGVTFFMTATILCFVLSRRPDIAPRAERAWMLAAWAAMACAVLSKGLVGVVLPALALALYMAVQRDLALLRRLHWLPGLALFLAIVSPWFILVQLKNPEFFNFFFIQEHFGRYTLPDHHRPGPWWYFVPVLLIALLPWTPSVPAAIVQRWKAPAAQAFNADRFLVIWAGVIVVFFSASHSKLPFYVLPAVPALLILLARHAPAMSVAARRAPAVVAILFGIAFMILAPLLPSLEQAAPLENFIPHYVGWLFAAGLALCAAGIAAMYLARRAHANASFIALGLGSLLAVQLMLSGTHVADEYYSSERLVERALTGDRLQFPRDLPFYSVATFDHTVPFYLGRPVTLVSYRGELAPGIAAEPDKYIATIDEFSKRWTNDADAYAIMTPQLYEKLKANGLPMRVVGQDVRRTVVAR